MADAYIGEIEIFAFGYAPRGWALCQGQLMAIQQNQALFSLLGTTFGGDGRTTFALPDLRGRLAMGQGNGQGLTPRSVGEQGGEENHTLSIAETPQHTHPLAAAANADVANNTEIPGPGVVLSKTTGKQKNGTDFTVNLYAADTTPNQAMASAAVGRTGGQPHNNLMPYLGVNFCICLQGIFPSRS